MKLMSKSKVFLVAVIVLFCSSLIEAKPLKVYILVGQSNMEGHAKISTFPAVGKDPKTVDIYKNMVDSDGNPVVCDNVWIAYCHGGRGGRPGGTASGKLSAGWGCKANPSFTKIGPEYTFGIYMNKMLGEPVLLIKAAWGGKSLHNDFRPPNAGDNSLVPPEKQNEDFKKATGFNYKLMMDHIKKVLADPKAVCPAYDPKEGYELAGFVWFQGFNDLVGPYPMADPTDKKSRVKDYSEYTRLLACFIRDVRKELNAPKLPFVIGILGVGGKTEEQGKNPFRKCMAAPAGMDEFKGNVVNVFTENYWPSELDPIQEKVLKVKIAEKRKRIKEQKENPDKDKNLSRDERRKAYAKGMAELEAKIKAALTEEEMYLWQNAISNAGYHYHGSAKFFGQVGKAFAEAIVEMKKSGKK